MKKCLLALLPLILITVIAAFPSRASAATGDPSRCAGNPVDFGIEKRFIPIGPFPSSGRQGDCMTPKYVVLHTTYSPGSAEDIFQYFFSGSGGRGVGSQYVVGKAGEAIQLGETMDKEVDILNHAAGYNRYSIGIEIVHDGVYNSKAEAPPAQYQKVLDLVRALIKQYNIPPNDVQFASSWKAPSDAFVDPPGGTYGHYQVNPESRSDPGEGFQRDILQDIGSGAAGGAPQTAVSNCVVTKIGNPTGPTPTLPPSCPVGSGGLGIEGLETPPNLECKPDGYCKMPEPTDGSYAFEAPSCHGQHWGSKELISVLYTVAKNWKAKYQQGRLNIGDLTATGHKSHFWGRAVDMDATTNGTDAVADYVRGGYNRDATIELGKMFANTNHVLHIWYNDQSVNNAVLAYSNEPPGHSKGMVMQYEDLHDNHFHVDVKQTPEKLPYWDPGC